MPTTTRDWDRVATLKELYLIYEGRGQELAIRAPDISPRGMFINTLDSFPEGAVLKVRFRLARSNYRIQTRCEVRYCLPGVGVGVEFIDIDPSDEKAIREEIREFRKLPPRKKATNGAAE
jgi:PilZ domain-containing protein